MASLQSFFLALIDCKMVVNIPYLRNIFDPHQAIVEKATFFLLAILQSHIFCVSGKSPQYEDPLILSLEDPALLFSLF